MAPETLNLGDVFAAHRDSDRIAVVDLYRSDAPREIDFRTLNAEVDALARGLVGAGLGKGDRVGILALNRVEFWKSCSARCALAAYR